MIDISHFREEQGKFPDYPSDEEGGSALIFHPGRQLFFHLFIFHVYFSSPETVHALDSDGETTKGKEEKGKKEEKKEGEEEEEKGFRLGPSDFLDSLKGGEKDFTGKTNLVHVRQRGSKGVKTNKLREFYFAKQ